MSEDIKKTIRELHIYEKKLLKELGVNPNATPEDIAETLGMPKEYVLRVLAEAQPVVNQTRKE